MLVLIALGAFVVPGGVATFEPNRRGAPWLRFESNEVAQVQTAAVTASPTALWEESPARQRVRAGSARLAYVDVSGRFVTAEQIRRFLESQGSPMAKYAENIVLAGNRYGVDPRLIVAISGVESTFGKYCSYYNAWGWNNGRTRWRSWTHAIDQFARAFAQKYPNQTNVRRMAPRYNPVTPDSWGRKVLMFMALIERQSRIDL